MPAPSPSRAVPEIRDHETIKLIGRGAFGEVWLAKSVTGALRAVKVVWRDDYDHEDSFEREFEAIKRFEPISRRHPGLVPVLQVGRSDSEDFYYYVMELADDLRTGREIDPETYEPHSLAAQMRKEGRIGSTACIEFGANIAEGLDYLHANNLIHRDVKPSNLIFIDGSCRLADLGLVALLGQRSFVGTEGFVAPEGPGTAASDIFSLGMVLYEASTGKDRLDFPDIPSASGSGDKLQLWRRLHSVICTACAPKARDRYESATEMALDLRGQPLPSRRRTWQLIAGGVGVLSLAVGFGMWLAMNQETREILAVESPPPLLTIRSAPEGATVFSGEEVLGETPLELSPADGLPVIYQLRLPGYRHMEVEHTAVDGQPTAFDLKLEASLLPQGGSFWANSLEMEFKPSQGGHLSVDPVSMSYFRRFLESTGRSFEGRVVRYLSTRNAETVYIVVVPPEDAEAFRYWLMDADRSAACLSQEHFYEIEPFYYVENTPTQDDEGMESGQDLLTMEGADWQAFHLRVRRQTYGSVVIRSVPDRVRVFHREEFLGYTPLEVPRVKSGPVEYELREEGFSDLVLEGAVEHGELLELFADMKTRKAVTFGREWQANSLGLSFVPMGEIMICVTETRRRDYLEYVKASGVRRPPSFDDGNRSGTLPVVGVDRTEAEAFCAWLTERERNAGLIGQTDVYRLPTDEEWSRAVGLPLERGSTPTERSGRIRGIYPWGFDWPPPSNFDNLADLAAARKASLDNVITSYEDNFPMLAPVTSLASNERGVKGLAGNVSEWVSSDYSPDLVSLEGGVLNPNLLGTLRGGNWRSWQPDELLSSARMAVPVTAQLKTVGFRLVLARVSN
jgi:hypothetical protein